MLVKAKARLQLSASTVEHQKDKTTSNGKDQLQQRRDQNTQSLGVEMY